MWTLPRRGLMAFMTLAIAGLAPVDVAAQDEPTEGPVCTATVLPTEIYANNPAFRLSVSLSQPIGDNVTFEPTEDSGLRLAATENLPRLPMASGKETPRPIEMANEGNRLTLWVSTVSAKAGPHAFTLVGPEGTCTGRVVINPAERAPAWW